MTWHLIVKTTNAEHRVFIGSDEDARAALAEVQALIGSNQTCPRMHLERMCAQATASAAYPAISPPEGP
jgi:hypothetical protein